MKKNSGGNSSIRKEHAKVFSRHYERRGLKRLKVKIQSLIILVMGAKLTRTIKYLAWFIAGLFIFESVPATH